MTPRVEAPVAEPPGPSRARRLAAAVLTAGLAFGAFAAVPTVASSLSPVGPVPDAAPDPVAGRGTMTADEVTLSGASVGADPSSRSRATAPAPGDTGWSTVVDLLAGTRMVALTWDGEASGPDGPASAQLSLRWSRGGGDWTPWLGISPDPHDGGGEGAGRLGSEVVWLGDDGADRLEVRIDAGPFAGLELLRMHHEEAPAPHAGPTAGHASDRASTSRAALPPIQPRSAWTSAPWASGTSGCGSTPTVASGLQHAVVHHTASTNSYTQAQVPGLIEAIRHYHTAGLGWCDIAYNFVVDRFGTIWQGRAGDITRPVVGGHSRGFNTGSVGVTFLGQFHPGASPASAQPTLAMIDSMARLLAWKLDLHGLDPRGTTTVTSGGSTRYPAGVRVTLPIVNAHSDHSLTACPGTNILSVMGAMRDLAGSHSTGSSPTTPSPPPTTTTPPPARDWTPFDSAEELTYRQFVDFLRTPGTWEDRRWWNDALNAGTTNRNALAFSLMRSTRSEERSAPVVRLYLAYFDRAPDHAGLAHWFGRMDGGEGIRTVSAAFARSPEFTARYGSLSDDQFVRLVYANVLGRTPDAAGFSYWTGRLRSRSESRGGLMALFSESGEYRALTRDATDVVLVHDAMLGRAASTAAMDTWVGRIQGGSSSVAGLIAQLFASTEYAARVG